MSKESKKEIRVRIAPSPTGPLHFGTARTALVNWLFARAKGGAFILRIEDTDLERSDKKYEEDIIEGLRWLGIDWDEGPFRQSERLDSYEKYLRRLLEEGKAYYCYCSKEELEEERQAMIAQGLAPKYSGRCRPKAGNFPDFKNTGKKPELIRFRMPEVEVSFTDIIRGKISFNAALFGDIAIAKHLRAPLYNFAVVVDDYEMRISHVIRGEDHIANTPKQILLQQALGFNQPQYAHLPLILSSDRSKMSKRYVETSLLKYRDEGYLPEALINFMALLGWHPAPEKQWTAEGEITQEREIFSREELIAVYDIKRVQKAGAVFSQEKLEWINSQHLRRLSDEEIAKRIEPLLESSGTKWGKELLLKVIAIEKQRAKTLLDIIKSGEQYLTLSDYNAELLIWQNTELYKIRKHLEHLYAVLASLEERRFTVQDLIQELMPYAEENGRGEVLWPLRVALSGRQASPGPFELAAVLGREEVLRRLKIAQEKLGFI